MVQRSVIPGIPPTGEAKIILVSEVGCRRVERIG